MPTNSVNLATYKAVKASKAVGSATQPVYIASDGTITACTAYGSASVSAAGKWATARTFTIGNTGKSVDGSADVSWSKAEILGSSTDANFYRGDQTWSNILNGAFTANGAITANGGYLISTNNNNTVTIGSQNASWCHITNSSAIPFWFNQSIEMEKGKIIGSTNYRPFQLYLGRYTTSGSNALNANNPLIEFSNRDRSQYCQLIYDDQDSLQAPDSLTLVGNQNGTTFICKNGPIWIQGGSNAGGNINRLTTSSGMPGNMQYNTSRRGTQIYSNGIAFCDPYNGNSNNDAGWIRHIEETGNNGYLEIAVGDDGSEEIIVRQYNTSNAVRRTMYLLNSSGFTSVSNTADNSSYAYAAMQIREENYGGSGSDSWGRAPRLAWHWSGRVAAQIGLASNGWLYEAPQTGTSFYRIVCETGTWGINITGSSASATYASSYLANRGSVSGSSHAAALQSYFNSYKASEPRNALVAHYSSAYGNGSMCFGYFLSGYDSSPYGGFFVAHYNTAYYVGIQGGSYSQRKIWTQGDSITSAVWNDYAEARESLCTEPGRAVQETGSDTLVLVTKRLAPCAGIVSDTWGFSQGKTDSAKTNIAVAGRVLAYPYRNRDEYKPGDVLCAAPGGTVDIMSREEVIQFPDRIVGTVSCVPKYEEWGGGEDADRPPVKVNGRIWVRVH